MKSIFFLIPCLLLNRVYFISSISCIIVFLINNYLINLLNNYMIFFTIILVLYFNIFKPYNLMFIQLYKRLDQIYLIKLSTLFCLIFFMSKTCITLFIFFELSIIPIFFILIIFGITERKILASTFLFVYTIVFSILFLSTISLIKFNYMMTSISMIYITYLSVFVSLSLSLMFLVKIPIFIIHIWLPKAHLESSNIGSMILAGILLKLGRYGLLIFFNFVSLYKLDMNYFVILYMIYIYMICIFCTDLKLTVAFFSIAHIAIIVSRLIIEFSISLKTCILIIISHTISSSALFLLIFIFYSIFSSRILVNRSRMVFMSNMSIWIFYYFLCLNISIPPSLNFFREIYFISIISKIRSFIIFIIILMVIFRGAISVLIIIKSLFMKEEKFIYSNSLEVAFLIIIKTFFAIRLFSIYILLLI